jgi:hypothetical protein
MQPQLVAISSHSNMALILHIPVSLQIERYLLIAQAPSNKLMVESALINLHTSAQWHIE